MTTDLRINRDRLLSSLMQLAEIGATPKGGNCRLALSALDGQDRKSTRLNSSHSQQSRMPSSA